MSVTKELTVEGMSCKHCEMAAQKALMAVPNVISAKADHQARKVIVELEGSPDVDALKQAISEAGYTVVSM
jgi:copper chaperone CopZ